MTNIKIDCKLLNEQITVLLSLLEMQSKETIDIVDGAICVLSNICYALEEGEEISIEMAEEE